MLYSGFVPLVLRAFSVTCFQWPRPNKEPPKAKTLPTSAENTRNAGGMVLPSLAVTAASSSATSTSLAHAHGPIGSGSATDMAMTAVGVGVVGIAAATAASAIDVGGGGDGGGSRPGTQTVGKPARDIVNRPGQPRKAQSSGNVTRAKKTRTEMPPQSDQLATAPYPTALSNPAAATMLPQGLGFPGLTGASIPTVVGVAGVVPPTPGQSPLAGTMAGGSATPTICAMDLAFLATTAAAATPPLGALGLYPGGHYTPNPAATAVVSLRGSEAPLAQVRKNTNSSSARADVADSTAAVATADVDGGAPILPPSSQELSCTRVSSSSTTACTPAAASTTASGVASGEGSSTMPTYPGSRGTAASTAPVSLDFDVAAGICPKGNDDTEEDMFLAFLVNSIDPSDPNTLRVRGAMMSRLKGIRRTTVAG